MRVMITGSNGFVAGSVIRQAGEDLEIHALSRGDALLDRNGLTWHTTDLSEIQSLRDLFDGVRPDALIHTAAIADIDYCEAQHDIAEAVNVGASQRLAQLCSEFGTRMIYVSTDTVFDGEKGNYSEEDPALPVNFYGWTKLKAEEIVLSLAPHSVVARTSLVMGLPALGTGNSFLSRMLTSLKAGKDLRVTDTEIRSPIDVITLSRSLLELASHAFVGRIHLSGNDSLNRYVMTQRILERFGYSKDKVVLQDTRFDPGRAARPRDASMCNAKAKSILKTPMQDFDGGLDLIQAAASERTMTHGKP